MCSRRLKRSFLVCVVLVYVLTLQDSNPRHLSKQERRVIAGRIGSAIAGQRTSRKRDSHRHLRQSETFLGVPADGNSHVWNGWRPESHSASEIDKDSGPAIVQDLKSGASQTQRTAEKKYAGASITGTGYCRVVLDHDVATDDDLTRRTCRDAGPDVVLDQDRLAGIGAGDQGSQAPDAEALSVVLDGRAEVHAE